MYENAFEKLRAATHYGTRGIAQQINMLHAENVAREETEPYRLYLLSPENYLFDELLTVRGADYDAVVSENEEKEYDKTAKKLVGAKAVPISANVAYTWYTALTKQLANASEQKRAMIKKAVLDVAKADPWVLQGTAALYTRAAILAETEDPVHAPGVWDGAFDWWKNFFAVADVADSQCFLTEKDEKKKDACQAAWGRFRNRLVEEIQKRCFAYIAENKGAAANACLETLKLSNVRLLCPTLFDETLKNISLKTSVAIGKCVNLADAHGLWEGLGEELKKNPSVLSAMLGAMAVEVDKIDKGRGDIDVIEYVWQEMDCHTMQGKGDITIAPALKTYYNAVSTVSTRVFNDTDSTVRADNLKIIAVLLEQLPLDHVVGSTATDSVTAAILLSRIAVEAFEKGSPSAQTTYGYFEELCAYVKKHSSHPALTERYTNALEQKVVQCVNAYGETKNKEAKKLGLAICALLPSNTAFPANSSTLGLNDIVRMLKDEEPPEMELLAKFVTGSAGSYTTQTAFRELKSCVAARNHVDKELDSIYQNVLINKLIECVNAWMDLRSETAKELGLMICGELPYNTTFPMGDTAITLENVRTLLTVDLTGALHNISHSSPPRKKKSDWSWGYFFGFMLTGCVIPIIVGILIAVFHWYPLAVWFKVVVWIYVIGWLVFSSYLTKIMVETNSIQSYR